MMNGTVFSLFLFSLATSVQGQNVLTRGKDFICCVDMTCGADGSNCAGRSDDPNHVCPNINRPYLCETVVCCMEDNCGGVCTEGRYADGQCSNGQGDMAGYPYLCTEQPFQCCDETCTDCRTTLGNANNGNPSRVIFGADSTCDFNNRNTKCATVYCCEGTEAGECTACSITGETAASCVLGEVGGKICASGGGNGDPHFETWNNGYYDFHGVCDLVLLDAPAFDGHGLQVHVRTSGRYEYSYISDVAIKLGTETLEIQSWGDYSLNGVSTAGMPNTLSGYKVTYNQINKKKHVFEVELSHDEVITVTTFKDIVNVAFNRATSINFGDSVGLMGEFGTGRKLARDGKTVMFDPIKFGNEWQVQDQESIFMTAREPQYPQQCVMPSAEQQESRRRRLGETHARADAEAACAQWGPDAIERCIFDVMVSGDLELAEAGAY